MDVVGLEREGGGMGEVSKADDTFAWLGVEGLGGVMSLKGLLACRGVEGSVRELLNTAPASLAFASSSQRKKLQPCGSVF